MSASKGGFKMNGKAIPKSDPPVEKVRIDRLLTTSEAAKALRVSRWALKDWRYGRYGLGPPFVKAGRHILYSATAINKWLRARTRLVVRRGSLRHKEE